MNSMKFEWSFILIGKLFFWKNFVTKKIRKKMLRVCFFFHFKFSLKLLVFFNICLFLFWVVFFPTETCHTHIIVHHHHHYHWILKNPKKTKNKKKNHYPLWELNNIVTFITIYHFQIYTTHSHINQTKNFLLLLLLFSIYLSLCWWCWLTQNIFSHSIYTYIIGLWRMFIIIVKFFFIIIIILHMHRIILEHPTHLKQTHTNTWQIL